MYVNDSFEKMRDWQNEYFEKVKEKAKELLEKYQAGEVLNLKDEALQVKAYAMPCIIHLCISRASVFMPCHEPQG